MTKDNRPPTLRDWLGLAAPFDFTKARALGGVLGAVLTLVALAFAALFFLSLAAAAFLVFNVFASEPGTASLGRGALLVALLGAPFLIWRTVVAQKTLDTAQRQTDLQAEAHFNDKINAAATDLAARRQVTRAVKDKDGKETVLTEWQDDLVTRAAAIDRLEGLALEAIDREDYAPAQRIARTLSIYAQELSPARDAQSPPEYFNHTQFEKWAEKLKGSFRRDVERAVQSLGRINPLDENARMLLDPTNINLEACCLQGFDLGGLNFQEAILRKSMIDGANLTNTKLGRAKLNGASLQGTKLFYTDLSGAALENCSLQGAKSVEADFKGASLIGADLRGTLLGNAKMQSTLFVGVRIASTNLTGTTLEEALIYGLGVEGKLHLSSARMVGAGFRLIEDLEVDPIRRYWKEAFFYGSTLPQDAPAHWEESGDTLIDDATFIAAWRAWAAKNHPNVTIAPDYRRD